MLNLVERGYSKAGISGRIVHELGRNIVSGVYQQGERLPNEMEFIAKFSGSRTVIREAFRVLSAKGLLEARQRAGTSVRARAYWNLRDPDVLSWHSIETMDKSTIRQLFELREIVEPEAARLLTIKKNSGPSLVFLETKYYMMERAWDENNIEKVRELEVAFHLALIDHCGNEFLARSRYAVQLLLRYIQEMLLSRDVEFAGAARWYSLILDKLKQGDADGVVSTVRSLIVRDRELLDQAAMRTEQDTSEVA
ncbi:MAG: FadR family transcriptional regulator [Sneathiella sp.]|nr:FadR family transcriptional regulator [Sneathiella sp.]